MNSIQKSKGDKSMKRWKSYRNYKASKNVDGTYAYFIIIDGTDVEVSETDYNDYKQECHKMEYMECDLKRSRVSRNKKGQIIKDKNGQPILLPEREVSLEMLMEEGYDYASMTPTPEELYIASEDSDEAKLHRCLAMLKNDEKKLIKALFFEKLTEQACAKILGINRQNVNKRKHRIFEKIKKIWEIGS